MKINLSKLEEKLRSTDKLKHKDNIQSNRDHLRSLKNKTSIKWKDYVTRYMIDILNSKRKNY